MLNPFPDLLMYGILAPTLIRIAVGATFFYLAVHHLRGRKESARLISPLVGKLSVIGVSLLIVIEIGAAAALIVGLYTQIAALITAVLSLKLLALRSRLTSFAPLSHATYLLLFVMSVSLLISGAGLLALDLPL